MQMTGVWSRKAVEFADQQAIERAKTIIFRHPYTIATIPEFAAEYAAIYGQDELAVLKASLAGSKFNMVQTYNQAWVVGGTWIPPAPKVEEVLGPDEEWNTVQTPFGTIRRKVKKGSVPAEQKAAGDIDAQQLEAIVFTQASAAMEAVLRKAGLIS